MKVEIIDDVKRKKEIAKIEYSTENDTVYIQFEKGTYVSWEIAPGLVIDGLINFNGSETFPLKIASVALWWASKNIIFQNKLALNKDVKEKVGWLYALDDKEDSDEYNLKINLKKNIAYIDVRDRPIIKRVRVAKNVLFDLDKENKILGIWLLNISDVLKDLINKIKTP